MTGSMPYKNLIKRPGRTAALVILSAFLCFAALAGSLVISGLKGGLISLETRLGADIMVVPYEAASRSELSDIVLQGNPGYFYMDSSIVDRIAGRDGIGKISPQFYLASSTASCCSAAVQIIGFDPETDFTILPWVRNTYKGAPGYMEVLVGNDLNAFPGDILTFYGSDVRVAARLDRTGTYLDTAVYAGRDTIQTLIAQAYEKKVYDFGEIDPYHVVSCVLVNVAEGFAVEDVLNDINVHIRKVEAVKTSSFLEDISGKLMGISDIIGWLTAAVWILSLIILVLAFVMISNERKKEFAVLRAMGASRRKLAGLIMKEAFMASFAGSLAGAVIAVVLTIIFGRSIENSSGLPFLLPGTAGMVILVFCSIAASILAGSVSAAVSAFRISGIDTALILRGEN